LHKLQIYPIKQKENKTQEEKNEGQVD
jgi:hypothetical protein